MQISIINSRVALYFLLILASSSLYQLLRSYHLFALVGISHSSVRMYLDASSTIACGIATVAASVGYVCARRLSTDSQTSDQASRLLDTTISIPGMSERSAVKDRSPSPAAAGHPEKQGAPTQTSGIQRRPSLKRKRTQEDQSDADAGYPHNLSLLYPPKKRSRTPTSEHETPGVRNTKPDTTEISPDTPSSKDSTHDSTQQPPATPILSSKNIAQEPTTSSPPTFSAASVPSTPVPRVLASKAFAAFAGTASPFPGNKRSNTSPTGQKSIWTSPNQNFPLSSPNDTSHDPDINSADGGATPSLALQEVAPSNGTKSKPERQRTGEEDEEVELELKGVKLFVKRGTKPFTDATVGHIKLLSNRKTLHERLLFRREPLWQVSMNVRVHPSMRCFFDREEKVLRVIAQESVVVNPVESSPDSQKKECEIVIYAMKPGRSCSKQDFFDFADSLVQSPSFKSKADT